MTQDELQREIERLVVIEPPQSYALLISKLVELTNRHVAEVIGENIAEEQIAFTFVKEQQKILPWFDKHVLRAITKSMVAAINNVKEKQRKRAGLE